jgi:steroid delta-isomerase-like uncharacterized protein
VRGELDAVAEHFTPDYVVRLAAGRALHGHDAIRAAVSLTRRAFSELQVEVEVLMESEDRVAWQRTLSGHQTGAYAGFPASGRAVTWRELVVSRFEGARIAEERLVSELAERLLMSRKGRGAS